MLAFVGNWQNVMSPLLNKTYISAAYTINPSTLEAEMGESL